MSRIYFAAGSLKYSECIQLELNPKDHWDLAVMLSIELVLKDHIPVTEVQNHNLSDYLILI
jgi:hypothetical protein